MRQAECCLLQNAGGILTVAGGGGWSADGRPAVIKWAVPAHSVFVTFLSDGGSAALCLGGGSLCYRHFSDCITLPF